MKLRFLFSILSLGLVLTLVLWQRETRPSPGPLSAVHERDKRIEEQDCELCHDAEKHSFTPCARCHEEVRRGIEDGTGFHGQLENPGDCGRCHAEHRGAGASLVTEAAFQRSGFESRDAYRHEGLHFDLGGAHAKLTCAKCHKQSGLPLLPEGKKRFLGLRQDCSSCHRDPHKGKQGKDCASCHGQEKPFDQVATFEHSKDFPLTAGHAGLACSKCHQNLKDRSPQEIRQETGKACADCHEDPHRPEGDSLQFATKNNCSLCHDTESFHKPLLGTRDHSRFGPALLGLHREEDCSACHAGGKRPSIAQMARSLAVELKPQVLGRDWEAKDPGNCVVCHLAPHSRSFLAGQGMGVPERSCARCHPAEARSFALPEARMSQEIHAKGGVPLAGAHEKLDCAACHPKPKHPKGGGEGPRVVFASFRRRFPGRKMGACRSCHEDVHGDDFAGGPFAKEECSTCHSDQRFSPSLFEMEAHARTGFALTGAHQALACTSCHKETRRLHGKELHRFKGLEGRCESCHQDPHGRRLIGFAGSSRDPKTAVGCARCHGTTDFHALKKGAFDHDRDTHFPLVGAHGKAACARCHAPATPGPGGTLRRESPPQTCEQCHDDPHLGQFRRTGRNDCLNCHGQEKFKPSRFDHEKNSRFPLGKNHAKVSCGACHKPRRLKTGEQVILYKPLPVTCKGCHGLPGKEGG